MAVTADLDIANLALARLGQDAISSLDDSSRDSTICNRLYSQNRDHCLARYNWVCITERIHMARAGKVAVTSITLSEPPVVAISGHEFISGDLVTFEGIGGTTELSGNMYVVLAYTSSTITLVTTEGVSVSATAYTSYTSGGHAYHSPGNDWAYVYALPSSTIRVLHLLDEEWAKSKYSWVRRKDRLYTDMQYAAVEYLPKQTDVTKYDGLLVDYMASRLALLIQPMIAAGNDGLHRELINEHLMLARQAQQDNAIGRQNREAAPKLWSMARR